MQAILTDFTPLIQNNIHQQYNDFWKFTVTLDDKGNIIKGEAMAKNNSGSKNWKKGVVHEFEKKSNDHAVNGIQIKGLKSLEQPPSTDSGPVNIRATTPHDMKKEAYVISRFAHTFALDYLNSLPEAERLKIHNDIEKSPAGGQQPPFLRNQVVSKFALATAKTIYEVANEVLKLHEKGNG